MLAFTFASDSSIYWVFFIYPVFVTDKADTSFSQEWGISAHNSAIVAKKWEPGNLVPSRFSGEIRKVEARLGKLAKIRKVETD